MSAHIKSRVNEDMKAAMRAKDKERLSAIRLITAAIKQVEVDQRTDLDDAAVTGVLQKMLKQRRDSLTQYRQAGRDDLAEREAFEIELIETYLPAPLDDSELDALIRQAITQTKATSMRDMGKVMAHVKDQAAGRADMSLVSARVKQHLS